MFNTDPQLVSRCLSGKLDAFTALYDRHEPRVLRLLCQLTGNVTQAEDLTQETFLAAYQSLSSWRGEGAFGTWLCGIAYRRYANACRKRQEDAELLDDALEIAAPDSAPLLYCTRREREQRLETAIAGLPVVCREVFVLVRVEEFTHREAAHLLDVPIGTVQSRLWRAVRLLQAALATEYPDHDPAQTARNALAATPTTPMTPNRAATTTPSDKPAKSNDAGFETRQQQTQRSKPHVVRKRA